MPIRVTTAASLRAENTVQGEPARLLYLCAQPQWWNYGLAGRLAEDPFSVHGEDDRGGSYVGSYARNTVS